MDGVDVSTGRVDRWVWEGSVDGSFSVKSLFHVLDRESMNPSPSAAIGKLKAPPRVEAFARLALSGCILTMDNLRKHKIILVNGCLMCLRDAESMDHLLSCDFACFLWSVVF
eukprot:TRINITY_DN73049_c0_g1_i1.p1 TRINITY_DN73049_c0_g1~~TRINITY_DN73049_c0_g1_i1.p1  ORF type:complete len:112 (-),score=16.12 TRINITY_DN73049_c0_g1_i1:45-380(-)